MLVWMRPGDTVVYKGSVHSIETNRITKDYIKLKLNGIDELIDARECHLYDINGNLIPHPEFRHKTSR